MIGAPRRPLGHELDGATLGRLTRREREVLEGVERGLTNKEIGAELGISHRTVENHRARTVRKLGARLLAPAPRDEAES